MFVMFVLKYIKNAEKMKR